MQYVIHGLNRETGEPKKIEVTAVNENDAIRLAGAHGLVVEKVEECVEVKQKDLQASGVIATQVNPKSLPTFKKFKVVRFSPEFDSRKKGGKDFETERRFEDLLNEQASQGWIFERLESVDVRFMMDTSMFGTQPRVESVIKYLAVFF